jgi:hypothetical protein
MSLSQIWLLAGGSIFAVIGTLHALYTLLDMKRPRRLVPDDPAVMQAMASTGVRMTRGQTTMWRAWVGFNFTHSIGLVMFGAACIMVGVLLAVLSPPRAALFIPVAIACLYELLAVRYFFRIPAIACAVAIFCFVAAWLTY